MVVLLGREQWQGWLMYHVMQNGARMWIGYLPTNLRDCYLQVENCGKYYTFNYHES